MHLLDLGPGLLRERLGKRELGMRAQSRERRAQLVRGVGEEALLVAVRFLDLHQQLVQRLDQRVRLCRRQRRLDRPQVAWGKLADLAGEPFERRQAPRHAEPHQRERQHREQRLRHDAAEQDLAHQAVALARRLGDRDGADLAAAGRQQRRGPDPGVAVGCVVKTRAVLRALRDGRRRDSRVAGDQPARWVAHQVVDRVELVGAQDLLGGARQVDRQRAVAHVDAIGKRDPGVDERAVVGIGGGLAGEVVRRDRPATGKSSRRSSCPGRLASAI